MQPDGRQSFIQRLTEPAGWLSSDLALDCTSLPAARPRSPRLKEVIAEGRGGRCAAGTAARRVTCHRLCGQRDSPCSAGPAGRPARAGAASPRCPRSRRRRAGRSRARARTARLICNDTSEHQHETISDPAPLHTRYMFCKPQSCHTPRLLDVPDNGTTCLTDNPEFPRTSNRAFPWNDKIYLWQTKLRLFNTLLPQHAMLACVCLANSY